LAARRLADVKVLESVKFVVSRGRFVSKPE
jgi:hypothetical protein